MISLGLERLLVARARCLNKKSTLLTLPSKGLFNSFFNASSNRVALFVRPRSRYSVEVFATLLMTSLSS